jgi:hypothetical protein
MMNAYVILRRGGWQTAEELQAAAERSTIEGDKVPDDIRWIRSYVLEEGSLPPAERYAGGSELLGGFP